MTDNSILTTADVAKRLGIHPRTVIRLVERKALKATKAGQGKTSAFVFLESDVIAYEKKLAAASKKGNG